MNRTTPIAIAAGVLMAVSPQDQHVVSAREAAASEPGLGSRIVFASTQNIVPELPPSLTFDPRMQLYVMNADGSEQRQITDFLSVKLGAACSPDGRQIAFHVGMPFTFNSRPVPSIFLMNADSFVGPSGEGLTEIVSGGLFPRWSPNGREILFQSPPPRRDVFVLDLTTMEVANLTNDPNTTADDAWDDFRPDWSPDGQKIAFTSNRSGNPEIYVMNADGSDPVRLTFSNGLASNGADWSPNGKQIAFYSNRDHPEYPDLENQPGSEIYVMHADGEIYGLTRLTDNGAREGDPKWSPDGSQIVFESDRIVDMTLQVYVMNADGSDQHPLTGSDSLSNSHGENSHPDWCRGHAAQP